MPDTELSLEELAQKDGKEGMPVYIAYKGKIYDVSTSKLWKTGSHMKRHPSGKDLTTDLSAAPHGPEVFDRYPQVGIVRRKTGPEIEEKTFLEPLFKKIPFLRRHPHPMTVHFPIVFFIFAPLFTLLFVATGLEGFDLTALNCLIAGLLFSLIVIPTGLFTWWVNYEARPMRPVTIKIVLSLAMFVVGLAALIWRLDDLEVLKHIEGWNILYLVLVLLLLPMILVVAALGATLTFPLKAAEKPRA